MNRVILIGRLTKSPDIKYTAGTDPMCVARFNLAVDRDYKKKNEERQADFISCVAFGKNGEFVEKYCVKGKKYAFEGRIQTGKFDDKDGKTVYTTDVVIERIEFVESKTNAERNENKDADDNPSDVPQGFSKLDEDIPF